MVDITWNRSEAATTERARYLFQSNDRLPEFTLLFRFSEFLMKPREYNVRRPWTEQNQPATFLRHVPSPSERNIDDSESLIRGFACGKHHSRSEDIRIKGSVTFERRRNLNGLTIFITRVLGDASSSTVVIFLFRPLLVVADVAGSV